MPRIYVCSLSNLATGWVKKYPDRDPDIPSYAYITVSTSAYILEVVPVSTPEVIILSHLCRLKQSLNVPCRCTGFGRVPRQKCAPSPSRPQSRGLPCTQLLKEVTGARQLRSCTGGRLLQPCSDLKPRNICMHDMILTYLITWYTSREISIREVGSRSCHEHFVGYFSLV